MTVGLPCPSIHVLFAELEVRSRRERGSLAFPRLPGDLPLFGRFSWRSTSVLGDAATLHLGGAIIITTSWIIIKITITGPDPFHTAPVTLQNSPRHQLPLDQPPKPPPHPKLFQDSPDSRGIPNQAIAISATARASAEHKIQRRGSIEKNPADPAWPCV